MVDSCLNVCRAFTKTRKDNSNNNWDLILVMLGLCLHFNNLNKHGASEGLFLNFISSPFQMFLGDQKEEANKFT